MNARVRTTAPTRAGRAAVPPEKRYRKNTGRNEMRDRTTRSIGSRRSGRESRSPMYHACRRLLFFNGSPHDRDERFLQGRRLERDLLLVRKGALDDAENLPVRLRREDLPPVAVRGLDHDPQPRAGDGLRLLHGPEERDPPGVDDREAVRELLRLVHVVRREEDRDPLA